jgi:hypothetical protein
MGAQSRFLAAEIWRKRQAPATPAEGLAVPATLQ